MRRRGAHVKKRIPDCLGYTANDGHLRFPGHCPVCRGFGSMDWRDQRRANLSSKPGDPHMRCPHCLGLGIVWTKGCP